MDKVVHFEIPADDIERAQKFYSETFGWKMNPVPGMGYTILHTVEVDEKQMPRESGAINGGMMQRRAPVSSPVVTINVADIDASLKKVEAKGGKIVMEKQKVGDMGYSAYVKDTEGNIIGLWQEIKR